MEEQIRQSNRELIAMSRIPNLSPRDGYMESRHLSKDTQELLQRLTSSGAINYPTNTSQISPATMPGNHQRLPPLNERNGLNLTSPRIAMGPDSFSPRNEISQPETRVSRPGSLMSRGNIQMISPTTPHHSPVLGGPSDGANLRTSQDINKLSLELALRNSAAAAAQNNLPLMPQLGPQQDLGMQVRSANPSLSSSMNSAANHPFLGGSSVDPVPQSSSVANSFQNSYINQLILPQLLAAQALNANSGILSPNGHHALPALLPGGNLGVNGSNQHLQNLSPNGNVLNPLLLNPTIAAVLMQQNSLLLPALLAQQNATKSLHSGVNTAAGSNPISNTLDQSNLPKSRALDASQYETIKPILPKIPETKPTALPQPPLSTSSIFGQTLLDKPELLPASFSKRSPNDIPPTGLLMPVPPATTNVGGSQSFDVVTHSTNIPLSLPVGADNSVFEQGDSAGKQKSEKETLVEIIQKNIMGQLSAANYPRKQQPEMIIPGRSSSTPSAQQGPSQDSSAIGAKKRGSLQLETGPVLGEETGKSPSKNTNDKQKSSGGKVARKRRHPVRETVSASDIFNDESSRSGNSSPSVGFGSVTNSSSPLVHNSSSDSSRVQTPSSSLLSALASYNEQKVCQLLNPPPGGFSSNCGSLQTTPSKHVNLKKSWAVQYQQQEEVPAIMPDATNNASANINVIEDCNDAAKKMRMGGCNILVPPQVATPPQKPLGRKSSKETISVSDIFSSKKPADSAYQKLLESSSSPDSSSGHPKPPEIPGSYLQVDTCCVITPKPNLMCRDCRARGTGNGGASTGSTNSSGSNSTNSGRNITRCNSTGKLYCRFASFRKLKNSKNKYPSVVGFLDANKDAGEKDVKMWKTLKNNYRCFGPPELVGGSRNDGFPFSRGIAQEGSQAPHKAIFRLAQIGTALCQIIHQEQKVHRSYNEPLYWKRLVGGCREVCDVCCTSLFNLHWLCPKCGFVSCLDCYDCYVQSQLQLGILGTLETQQDCHGRVWLKCTKAPHDRSTLKLTQFIPQKSMDELLCVLHSECKRWSIPHNCHLMEPDNHFSSIVSHPNMSELLHSHVPKKSPSPLCGVSSTSSPSPPMESPPKPALFTNNHLENTPISSTSQPNAGKPGSISTEPETIATVETPSAIFPQGSKPDQCQVSSSSFPELAVSGSRASEFAGKIQTNTPEGPVKKGPQSFNVIIDRLVESSLNLDRGKFHEKMSKNEFLKFENLSATMSLKPLSNSDLGLEAFGFSEDDTKPSTSMKTSNPPSMKLEWLLANCTYVSSSSNVLSLDCAEISDKEGALFSAQWRLNKPVIVRGCGKNDLELKKFFSPEFLLDKFGEWKVDLVDCRTGRVHPMMLMNKFLQGFDDVTQRKANFGQLSNGCNIPPVLKLKDWPPTTDFSDVMPMESFNSLMAAIPLADYTKRSEGGGAFNLACSLPSFCCAPDMGPKMFIAYGSPGEPNVSSTNLHIDMSDAVNILLHVSFASANQNAPGLSTNHNSAAVVSRGHSKGASSFADEEDEVRQFGGEEAVERLRNGEKPGAVWNIFNTDDNKALRKFLRNEAEMMHKAYRSDDDPIHDQEIFLGPEKLKKLKSEEGIEPYTFVQFENDCVFIPAGAAHQVRNLNSCVKAAVDFVSPERVRYCLKTTDEFRNLSDKHSNHEDKLQIKSVIYHAVKDSLSVTRFHNPATS